MTRRRDDVAVLVEESGRVWVNDVLVAETAVGITTGRDTLLADLTLHRVASAILHRLDELDSYLEDLKAKPSIELAEGWLDGYRGFTQTIGDASVPGGVETKIPPKFGREYTAGYHTGRHLAAMQTFLIEHKDLEG